ncbi:hypothetical protein GCM10010385_01970 [Streptomyces geysiriensis]|nr:hypothetical protein GCM10010385_01970 [Streptomyces geysiriensis]
MAPHTLGAGDAPLDAPDDTRGPAPDAAGPFVVACDQEDGGLPVDTLSWIVGIFSGSTSVPATGNWSRTEPSP